MAIMIQLADILARIRNGQLRGLAKVSTPARVCGARLLDGAETGKASSRLCESK